MSIKLMSLVMETSFQPTPKIVLLVLSDRADDNGGSLWPSNDEIARKASLSVRQVQRLLHWFDAIGLVRVVGNERGGKAGDTARRVINVAMLREFAAGMAAPKFTQQQQTGDLKSPVEVIHTGDSEVTPRVTFAPDTGDSEVTLYITNPSNNPPLPPKPPEGAVGGVEESFAKVWNAYPKQTKRAKALEAFKAQAPDAALVDRMLKAIARQKGGDAWKLEGGRFIPALAKWLDDRRWEDGEPLPTGDAPPAPPAPAAQAPAQAEQPPAVPAPASVRQKVVAMKQALAKAKLATPPEPRA